MIQSQSIEEDAEAQRGKATCPRPRQPDGSKQDLEPTSTSSQLRALLSPPASWGRLSFSDKKQGSIRGCEDRGPLIGRVRCQGRRKDGGGFVWFNRSLPRPLAMLSKICFFSRVTQVDAASSFDDTKDRTVSSTPSPTCKHITFCIVWDLMYSSPLPCHFSQHFSTLFPTS